MQEKKRPLSIQIITILVSVVTIFLVIFVVVTSLIYYKREMVRLHNLMSVSTKQLQISASIAIWSFDDIQLNRMLDSTMEEPAISGIIIRGDRFEYFRSRDIKWNIDYVKPDILQKGLISSELPISYSNKDLGTITVFVTTKFIKNEIIISILIFSGIIILLDIALILCMYRLFNIIILTPLKKLETYALEISSSDAGDVTPEGYVFSEEMETLRLSLEKMFKQIKIRYEELAAQNEEFEALNDELIKTNRDLLDSENSLSKSLREKETLIREIYHRTKNTMQVIRGMIILQAEDYPSNIEVQQLVKNTEDRIQSISLVHQMLYQSQDLSQISIRDYVNELSDGVMQSFDVAKDRISLNLEIEDHKFLLDTAIPFGLILNELMTNSLKYAFPDNKKGVISIALSRGESDINILKYSDNGIGVPDGFDFRKQSTMGLQLIFGLGEQQMMGKVTMKNNSGIECVFEFHNNLYKARV